MNSWFKTKNKARDYLISTQGVQLKKYCPHLKKQCSRDCASFKEGKVQERQVYNSYTDLDRFSVLTCECENAIVRGYIYHEGNISCDL